MQPEKQPTLCQVYLAAGVDALKRKTAVKRIKSYLKPECKDFNLSEFDAQTLTDPTTLSDALEQMPVSDERRVVIIYSADKLRKDVLEVVLNYLESPNPSTILLLEAEKLPANTRLRKAIAAQKSSKTIDCELPKGYEMSNYVQAMAQKRHGITLEFKAVSALLDVYGQKDLGLIDSALEMLSRLNKNPLSERDVLDTLPRLESPKPWLFAEALSERNYEKALLLFAQRKPGEESLLFWYATNRLRELIAARTVLDEGRPQALETVLPGPAWKYRNHINYVQKFSPHVLSKALQKAPDVEAALKGSQDAEIAFKLWIAYICNEN